MSRRPQASRREARTAPITLPCLYHGFEAAAWPAIDAMRARCGEVRVGLEDVLVLPDRQPVHDNAAEVAAALAIPAG